MWKTVKYIKYRTKNYNKVLDFIHFGQGGQNVIHFVIHIKKK